MARLGDYVNIKTGKLDANAASEDGQYPFFTCAITPLRIDTYSYDCECVLVAGNGDLNVKYYSGKFDAYQRTYIIESKNKNNLSLRYLYYFLEQYVETLRKESIGGVIKYIKLGNLTETTIPLPPLEEQHHIAALLDKVSDLIAKRQAQLDKLDELVKARFVEMFVDYGHTERLEHFATLITKGASPKWQGIDYEEKGTLFITSENVQAGYVDFGKRKYLNNQINQIQPRSILRRNDVLINIVGASIGRAAIFESDELANINQAVALVRVDTKQLNLQFLITFLNSSQALELYSKMKKGGARDNLSLKNIADLPIPVVPITLQGQFSDYILQIDKSKLTIQQSLDKLEVLKKALMQQYFG